MAGEYVPLLSVAQVSVKDTNTLIVTAFDVNDAASVEAAIRASDLGLEPARDAKIVRVGLPKMTTDFRNSLVRRAKENAEKAKVRMRRVSATPLERQRNTLFIKCAVPLALGFYAV